MNLSSKITELISEAEADLGVEKAFPVTIELAKADLAARRLEVEAPEQHYEPAKLQQSGGK
jgi:hypothetical protein